MLDLLQAQSDLFGVLVNSPQLANFNIVLQRKEQLQSETYMATALTTPRNGCAGIAIIVEMPESACDEQNVPGPILDWMFPVWILENPQLNFARAISNASKGSGVACEQVMQIVFDEVHHYADERLSTFVPAPKSHVAAPLGTVALGYRLMFRLQKAKNTQTLRTGQVKIIVGSNTVDFVCAADLLASIYYTLDGSFPGPSNSAAVLYTGASVTTTPYIGQVVRVRAYATNKLGSATAFLEVDAATATAFPFSIVQGDLQINVASGGLSSLRFIDPANGKPAYFTITQGDYKITE